MPTLAETIGAKVTAFFAKLDSIMVDMTYRTKSGGSVDAATGMYTAEAETDYSFRGFPHQYSMHERSSMRDFEEGDLKILMAAPTEFTPTHEGFVVWDGAEWHILNPQPDPFGTSYTLQLRKQR